MPCNSEYMEPNVRERQRKQAASLLKYALEVLERPVPHAVRHDAKDFYGGLNGKYNGENHMKTLCSLLKSLDEIDIKRVVYNAHNKTSRQLADWWEEHQAEDLKRELAEAKLMNVNKNGTFFKSTRA